MPAAMVGAADRRAEEDSDSRGGQESRSSLWPWGAGRGIGGGAEEGARREAAPRRTPGGEGGDACSWDGTNGSSEIATAAGGGAEGRIAHDWGGGVGVGLQESGGGGSPSSRQDPLSSGHGASGVLFLNHERGGAWERGAPARLAAARCGGGGSGSRREGGGLRGGGSRPEGVGIPCRSESGNGRSHARTHAGRGRPWGWLWCVVVLAMLELCGGWIALSKEGYSMKHQLIAQAGMRVSKDTRINGVLVSRPVANLQCNPSRRGALRWNEDYFEACDGETDWRPITFCSRSCDINTNSVPCGLPVRNKCDQDCRQTGTGLNMRQCFLGAAATPCRVPVTDQCGNYCGLRGTGGCDQEVTDVGELVIRSLEGVPTTASFSLSVGRTGSPDALAGLDNAAYMSYQDAAAGVAEDIILIKMLDERHAVNDTWVMGMEFAKPPDDPEATLRVSMLSEFTGQYVRVGTDSPTQPSHVFVDGVIDKECPFLFNAGSYEGSYMKVCLEPVTANQKVTFPDVSGVAISSGNSEDLRSFPGLKGNHALVFASPFKNLESITPDPPRVGSCPTSCPATCGTNGTAGTEGVNGTFGTNATGRSVASFAGVATYDLFRVYYTVQDWQNPNINASDFVRAGLLAAFENGASREELASTYMRLSYEETLPPEGGPSMDLNGTNYTNVTYLNDTFVAATVEGANGTSATVVLNVSDLTGGNASDLLDSLGTPAPTPPPILFSFADMEVTPEEVCFVCCCPPEEAATWLGVLEDPACLTRTRPLVCLGGLRDTQSCINSDECVGGGGGECVEEHPNVVCFESDWGWECTDVRGLPNVTTTVDFRDPEGTNALGVPDASGTVITTGNLHDVTSLGVLSAPMPTLSARDNGNGTRTTTLAFDAGGAGGVLQRSATPANSTLLIPNGADGVLLSTGNLEDITIESGSLTGLGVQEDLHVRGWLSFGDDSLTSGLRAPPTAEGVSDDYVRPHGGQDAGAARPGLIPFSVRDSRTVLEFEPAPGPAVLQITVPAANGTIVTSGNLESVTAESGAMSSIRVEGRSYLQGGLTVGAADDTQLTVQGGAGRTVVFESPTPAPLVTPECNGSANAYNSSNASNATGGCDPPTTSPATATRTELSFRMAQGVDADIVFPAASGRVITGGNLPDIHAFTGAYINASGATHMRGDAFLGSGGLTPMAILGYLTGDLTYRTNVAPASDPLLNPVALPNSFSLHPSAVCAGVPAPRAADPRGVWPLVVRFEEGEGVRELIDDVDGCRVACADDEACGGVVASRYMRVHLLALSAYPLRQYYLSSLPKKQKVLSSGVSIGNVVVDACYPGFEAESNGTNALADVYPYNFSAYPQLESAWARDVACQQASGIDWASNAQRDRLAEQWGGGAGGATTPDVAFASLELTVTACNGSACTSRATCPDLGGGGGCTALVRSRLTGRYLHASPAHGCSDVTEALSLVLFPGCAFWSDSPVPWRLSRANISGCVGCAGLDPAHAVSLERRGACADAAEGGGAVELTCGGGDSVAAIEFSWWGGAGGALGECGAYRGEEGGGAGCVDQGLINETLHRMCVEGGGRGCTIEVSGSQTLVTRTSDGAVERVFATCSLERLVVQASCTSTLILVAPRGGRSGAVDPTQMNFFGAVPSGGLGVGGLASAFYFLSDQERVLDRRLKNDCWLTKAKAAQCTLADDQEMDMHLYMRYEQTRLTFDTPSGPREQVFSDASGTLITSGNLRDVGSLRGLGGADTLVYMHSADPYSPVTILDFAAIGSGPNTRAKGDLPIYTRADGTPSQHTVPPGGSQRITFPDATGTVITTGNTEDLVFRNIALEGLDLIGEAYFREGVNFGPYSRITGCLNFITTPVVNNSIDDYTQLCLIDPTRNNTILLPDVSGTVISTGNTLNLPNTALLNATLSVGGDATFEGNVTWGSPDYVSTIEMYAWIDGDVGIALGTAAANATTDVVRLGVPHMGGLDIAIRHWLTDGAGGLNVDVQGRESFLEPVPGTVRVNQSVCYEVMREAKVFDYHGLGYFLLNTSYAVPTLLQGDAYAATDEQDTNGTFQVLGVGGVGGGCAAPSDAACAFDGDLMTFFEPAAADGLCAVGLRMGSPVLPSRARVFPREGRGEGFLGGVMQGRRDEGEAPREWVDLFVFQEVPKEGQWNDMALAAGGGGWGGAEGGGGFVWLRFLGNATAGACGGGEWEWHRGLVAQRLTPFEGGQRSMHIDQAALKGVGGRNSSVPAMVMKCAAQRWYPAYLNRSTHELSIPEASGILITTGNLRDITIEAGSMSSLGVSGDVVVGGGTVLGAVGKTTQLEVNSLVDGRFPLSFAGGGAGAGGSLTVGVQDPSIDTFVLLPEASGRVVTAGNLPPLTEGVSVVGEVRLGGGVRLEGGVTIGEQVSNATLRVHSALATPFPLRFSGSSPQNPPLTLGVHDPSRERLMSLPDVSGTVITTGNLPDVFEDVTFIGEAVFRGGASFLDSDVSLGERGGGGGVEVNAAIGGSVPLTFEGRAEDGRTLSLAVEEPQGRNVLTLPDVSGTIITTGNFPEILERVRVLGAGDFEGGVDLVGPLVTLGAAGASGGGEGGSVLTLQARIAGRYPLVFAEDGGGGASTTLEVTPPTRDNVIAFPDTSGTVITTGNIPSTVVAAGSYSIAAASIEISSPSVALGRNAQEPVHAGSFIFSDESDEEPAQSQREGSFTVRATGGVRFVTGQARSGRDIGVVLQGGSSAWSVLSDEGSKEKLGRVGGGGVLEKLRDLRVPEWEYEGGGGERHVGPMAQDFFDAFGLGGDRTRISGVDADGVALAALHGLYEAQRVLEGEWGRVWAAVQAREGEVEAAEEVLGENERVLFEQEEMVEEMERALCLVKGGLGGGL